MSFRCCTEGKSGRKGETTRCQVGIVRTFFRKLKLFNCKVLRRVEFECSKFPWEAWKNIFLDRKKHEHEPKHIVCYANTIVMKVLFKFGVFSRAKKDCRVLLRSFFIARVIFHFEASLVKCCSFIKPQKIVSKELKSPPDARAVEIISKRKFVIYSIKGKRTSDESHCSPGARGEHAHAIIIPRWSAVRCHKFIKEKTVDVRKCSARQLSSRVECLVFFFLSFFCVNVIGMHINDPQRFNLPSSHSTRSHTALVSIFSHHRASTC